MQKLILYIVFLGIVTSCRKEEDKHPEIPLFDINFSNDLCIEESNTNLDFIADSESFIYLFDNTTEHLIIRERASKKIVFDSKIEGKFEIDYDGNVYFLSDDECFKLKVPLFEKSLIKSLDLNFLSSNEIAKTNLEEMHALKIKYNFNEIYDTEECRNFIITKRNIALENHVLVNYKNIFLASDINIIRYKDGKEFYIGSQDEYFEDYPKNLVFSGRIFSKNSEQIYINKSYTIAEFDNSVLIDYNFSGGNHFVPGFNTVSLYYYELKISNKVIRFKSYSPLQPIVSFNNEILIQINGKTYKFELK